MEKMTRSKILKIKFFVILLIFLLSQISACDGNFREKYQSAETVPLDNKNDNKENKEKYLKDTLKESYAQIPVYNASVNNLKKMEVNITSKTTHNVVTTSPPVSTVETTSGMHIPTVNYGALKRGVYVIFGLSMLVMAYLVFRRFRLSKSRAQMVRKYGVLAHRQDVEMRPLPLDEDDDDDTTVFDASNISSHRQQSQDS